MDPILLSAAGDGNGQGALEAAHGNSSSGNRDGILTRAQESQRAEEEEGDGDADAANQNETEEAADDEEEEEVYEMALFAEYPEPLTEPQRRAFQRHVAQAVRKHTVLRRTSRLIRRGLSSLESLVNRLRQDKVTLQGQLDAMNNNKSDASTNAPPPPPPPRKAAKTEDSVPSASTSASTEATAAAPAKRPNRFGGLLRSAAFANMQKVLSTVQKEEAGKFAEVAQTRERIARETRLQLLSQDLATQEAVLNPLLEKLDKCTLMEREAETAVASLLQLLSDMFVMESKYAASFTLKAVDASAVAALDSCGGGGGGGGGARGSERKQLVLPTASRTYEVPFMPAMFTPEIEEIVRSQVEEVIAEYKQYRARIDPIVSVLEEEERARKAKRLDDLMNVIGVTNADVLSGTQSEPLFDPVAMHIAGGGGNGLLDSGAYSPQQQSSSRQRGETGRRRLAQREIKAGFGVSDSDSGNDDEQDGDSNSEQSEDSLDSFGATAAHSTNSADKHRSSQGGQTGSSPSVLGGKRRREEQDDGTGQVVTANTTTGRRAAGDDDNANDRDQKDRKLIQSALSALDDFDEMF